MGAYDGVWRIIASRSLAVNSSGGTVSSTGSMSAQTRVVELICTGAVTSSAGIRFDLGPVGSTVVHSTNSPVLVPGVPRQYLVSPGMQIAALSNDGSAAVNMTIIELGT
jgi:hypothetical protein